MYFHEGNAVESGETTMYSFTHAQRDTRKLFVCFLSQTVELIQTTMTHYNFACRNGHTEIVRMILDLPVELIRSWWGFACKFGRIEIVRLLLALPPERGVNLADNLQLAILNGAC